MPHKKQTHQGAADESAWARGQAWALYGFTMMYRETGKPDYLNHAKHIASFIMNHPNMPVDKIPYWDFDAPGIPNVPRDASAAAIMASALIELSQLDKVLSKELSGLCRTTNPFINKSRLSGCKRYELQFRSDAFHRTFSQKK